MAKKKPKAPKKPKRSAPVGSWEKYDKRHAEWKKKCHDIDAAEKKKESLIKKYS